MISGHMYIICVYMCVCDMYVYMCIYDVCGHMCVPQCTGALHLLIFPFHLFETESVTAGYVGCLAHEFLEILLSLLPIWL